MFKRTLALALIPAALLLSACSGNKDLAQPVEAPEVDNRFDVQEVWSDSTGGTQGVFSKLGPAVLGNTVYAASRAGDVWAIDLSSGDKKWVTDLGDEDENDDESSARISGAVSAMGTHVAAGTENGWIYVLNAASGKLEWKNYLGAEINCAPTFSDDATRLFVLDSRGLLTAFDTATGEKLWQSGDSTNSLRLRTQARPVAAGSDFVLMGTAGGRVLVLDQRTGVAANGIIVGNPSGSSDLERMSDVSSTPLILNGNLYSTAYNSGFTWYSFKDHLVWNRLSYHSSNDISFDSDYFVLTGDNGHVYCISRNDGSELWENSQLTFRNVSAPAIYGNYVVVGDLEGYVYFISLSTGRIEWMDDTDDTPIYTAPQVTPQGVLVQTSGGRLVLLRHNQGVASAKLALQQSEMATGAAGVSLAAYDDYNVGGITEEQLMQRRAQAQRMVNEMEARQRRAEAQLAQYRAQKAEYERQRAEYEKAQKEAEEQRRQAISGYGLMDGVNSDSGDE